MKTITGILVTYALVVPASPAAAQSNLGYQIDRIINSALTLAADSLDELVDERADRQQRGDRGRADRGPEYTEKVERTVKIGRTGRLELTNFSGDIEVTGGSGEDAKITATKVTHSTSEATAKTSLSNMAVEIEERAGGVVISAQPTRGRSSGVDVNYVITVPAGASLDLKTYSGDVTIRSVSGDVRLKSYSGDVVVRDSKPADLEIDATSGDISLEQVESDRVRVNTLSGDVVLKGKLSKTGHYELRSTSGDVQIVTDKDASFQVEAGTFSGDITSDFPLKLGGNIQASSFGPGRGPKRSTIRGVAGDGGAVLSLQSLSGDILITKR